MNQYFITCFYAGIDWVVITGAGRQFSLYFEDELTAFIKYTRYPPGKWIQEWRKNEIKSIQHVLLRNYIIIKNTAHGMKYLRIM